MFLDKLNETEQVVFHYLNWDKTVKSGNKLSENLDSIRDSLQEFSTQLDASTGAKKELVPEAGLSIEQKEEFYSRLHQLYEDLDNGVDVSEESKKLQASVKAFVVDENQKWRQAVEAKANTQISLLQELGKYTDDPTAASTIQIKLKAGASQMPKTTQAIYEFGKMLDHAQNIVKNAGGTSVVMDFIHKLNMGQAALSDLNDEIWAWIRERKMENKMKITF